MAAAQRWRLRREESPQAVAEMGSYLVGQAPSLLTADPALFSDPILARVLYARRIEPARIPDFIAVRGNLGDPFQMAGMARAVTRLRQAIRGHEPVVVYGDFDADGVSATVLLTAALQQLGARVQAYIPDRFSEAYGLNKPALQRLQQQGARLVVTVDCGVRSVEEVVYAKGLGLDIIVTDHHSVPAELPPAVAVLNPKQPICRYPCKVLSGVGVAYRLVEALFMVARQMDRREADSLAASPYLDLVALGTVADIVPLVDENRLLVGRGLQQLRASPRLGLAALMERAGVRRDRVLSQDIAFRLAPRLNAAGRLKSAQLAYDLLSQTSADAANELAAELNTINQQRQALLEKQVAEAKGMLADNGQGPVLVVDGPGFHEGIVGLVASRLVEEYHRPALVMRRGEEITRGSARSIEGFHITHALDHCAHLLVRHGGHDRAAGFTLRTTNLEAFRDHLCQYAAERLDAETLSLCYRADALAPLSELKHSTPASLALLEPFGEGNPEPKLATLGLRIAALKAVGEEGKHLQLWVSDDTRHLQAIAFRQGPRINEFKVGQIVDLIYSPTLHEWQGETSLQLVVEAMRPSGMQIESPA